MDGRKRSAEGSKMRPQTLALNKKILTRGQKTQVKIDFAF